MSVLDISGYSFSGKSAVYDLLSSSDRFKGHGVSFEFELLRAPGGIIELREALCGSHWSPVRSCEAVRRFLKLIDNLGGRRTMIDRFTKLGNHYDYHFPGFTNLSKSFIDKSISSAWDSYWPFAKYQNNGFQVFTYKLLSNFGLMLDDRVYLARMDKRDFDFHTREYLDKLFSSAKIIANQRLLLNNAFEPFTPSVSGALVSDAKAIIVDRDPRDIYLSAWQSSIGGGSKVGRAVIGNSVADFVKRFLIYRNAVVINDDSLDIYRMTFENLIQNFDNTLSGLCSFLNVNPSLFYSGESCFDPQKSSSNVGMWRGLSDNKLSESVKYIERELGDYCV